MTSEDDRLSLRWICPLLPLLLRFLSILNLLKGRKIAYQFLSVLISHYHRESVRPRLEIHVEEAEPAGVPVERETSGNSLDVSEEQQSLTFRVDDKSDNTDKKDISDKKVPKLKFAENEKLPPKRPKSAPRPPKEQRKETETAMMQRSML